MKPKTLKSFLIILLLLSTYSFAQNPDKDEVRFIYLDSPTYDYIDYLINSGQVIPDYALQQPFELDSAFYDAYLGVGSYKYWKSSKGKFLTWLK